MTGLLSGRYRSASQLCPAGPQLAMLTLIRGQRGVTETPVNFSGSFPLKFSPSPSPNTPKASQRQFPLTRPKSIFFSAPFSLPPLLFPGLPRSRRGLFVWTAFERRSLGFLPANLSNPLSLRPEWIQGAAQISASRKLQLPSPTPAAPSSLEGRCRHPASQSTCSLPRGAWIHCPAFPKCPQRSRVRVPHTEDAAPAASPAPIPAPARPTFRNKLLPADINSSWIPGKRAFPALGAAAGCKGSAWQGLAEGVIPFPWE